MAINNYKITLIIPKAPLVQPLKKIQSSRLNGHIKNIPKAILVQPLKKRQSSRVNSPIKNLIEKLQTIQFKHMFMAINGFGMFFFIIDSYGNFNSLRKKIISKFIKEPIPKKTLGFSEFLMEHKASKEFMAMNINHYVDFDDSDLGGEKTLNFQKLFNKKSFNDLNLAQLIEKDAIAQKVIDSSNWPQEIPKYPIKYQPIGPIDSPMLLLQLIYYSHNFKIEEFVNLVEQMPKSFINFTFQYLFSAYFINRRDHFQQFVEEYLDYIKINRKNFSIKSPVYYFIKIILNWESLAGQNNIADLNLDYYYSIGNEIKMEEVSAAVYKTCTNFHKNTLKKNPLYRNQGELTKKIDHFKNNY